MWLWAEPFLGLGVPRGRLGVAGGEAGSPPVGRGRCLGSEPAQTQAGPASAIRAEPAPPQEGTRRPPPAPRTPSRLHRRHALGRPARAAAPTPWGPQPESEVSAAAPGVGRRGN